MNAPFAIEIAGAVKRFGEGEGATLALNAASLSVRPGTVHAVLGENGAGKTTLMRIAFGLVPPDAGTLRVDGRPVRLRDAADAIALGVGMVHQHFTNVPAMTVAENVALGGRGVLRPRAVADAVRRIGATAGLALDPTARAGDLGVGAQQRLEIVKALARNARILILDEPTAVLAPGEADDLLRWLRGFADAGNSVVLVTHKLGEALAVADDLTILRRGQTVHSGPAGEMTPRAVAAAMVGAAPELEQRADPPAPGAVVVEVHGVNVGDGTGTVRIRDATFVVRAGEIVGVAAVEGAGHHDLLRALARRRAATSGVLRLPETIAFIPEDRHRDGLILDFSVAENVCLRGAGHRTGRLRWAEWRTRTRALAADFDVRGGERDAAARTLSGGNQQKLILARELAPVFDALAYGAPGLVVAENPTRGLDIRATADVHSRLLRVRDAGAAVVMHSADLDELLLLATRMLVVHSGRVDEVALSRDAVAHAMVGVT